MTKLPGDVEIRDMVQSDVTAVGRVFARLVPDEEARTWKRRLGELLGAARRDVVALVAAAAGGRVVGYLVGEVRAWEFGSRPAGWIFAVGVDPDHGGMGLGRRLRDEAVRRFGALGVRAIRTMVRKDNVRVLRFFRDAGFTAGPFMELELELPLPGGDDGKTRGGARS
jgi:ribosomal protein S18 acetylase RimI-like enzyme